MIFPRISLVHSSIIVNRFMLINVRPLHHSMTIRKSTDIYHTAVLTSQQHRKIYQSQTFTLLKPNITSYFHEQSRGYAKKKDKSGKGGKGKSSVIDISMEEMSEVINGEAMMDEFNDALEQLKNEYMKALAVRTNVGSIEDLPVEMDGETYPLNEVAEVHRKSPQLIIINCGAFPQYTKNVLDSITSSGMNLNPQQEGTKIAVPLPKITREHRESLSNKAKIMCNKCKDSIRLIHNNYSKKAKNKEGKVSDDLIFKVVQKIKEHQTNYVKDADKMLTAKQEELIKS